MMIDCGVKNNQIRCLVSRGVCVTVVPWNADILGMADQFDGVFISNGPGDPNHCGSLTDQLRELFDREQVVPTMGICMGSQLVGIAAGGVIEKMKYGKSWELVIIW